MALNTFAAGDTVSSSKFDQNFTNLASGKEMHYNATWTSYVPAWTCASGTAPAIGNGTLSGYYLKIGKIVWFRILLKAGNTTTFGNGGSFRFSLPVNNSLSIYPDVAGNVCGSTVYHDISAGAIYYGLARIDSGAGQNKVICTLDTCNSTYALTSGVTNAVPMAWTTNDYMTMAGRYESI